MNVKSKYIQEPNIYTWMVGSLIIGLCVAALIFFLIFLCLCVSGLLGCLRFITPFFIRKISSKHDSIYTQDGQPINNECFICLQKITNQIVATCNHSFCGQCIANYIQSNINAHINCPACRKEILVLFRRFQPVTDEQTKIKEFICNYNYKYARQPSILRSLSQFGNTLRNIPILLSASGLTYLLGDSRLKYIILLTIYALSPFDLLPEAVLGPVGLIDDGIVVAGIIQQMSAVLYGYARQQIRRQ